LTSKDKRVKGTAKGTAKPGKEIRKEHVEVRRRLTESRFRESGYNDRDSDGLKGEKGWGVTTGLLVVAGIGVGVLLGKKN
jgi:hypothetical protein